jgi:hypothetical protein
MTIGSVDQTLEAMMQPPPPGPGVAPAGGPGAPPPPGAGVPGTTPLDIMQQAEE